AIAEWAAIPVVDRSLGELREYAEIAGIVLVALAGGHILACASFKMWLHDKLMQFLAKLLDKLLRELGTKPVERTLPAPPEDGTRPSSADPDPHPPDLRTSGNPHDDPDDRNP